MMSPPLPAQVAARAFLARYSKAKMVLAGVLVVGALLVAGLKSVLSIDVPHGFPLGESHRAGNAVVTLIQTLEPYVPSLNRNHENDRYSVALFVAPVDGSSPGNLIPIAKGFRSSELLLARILGFDGNTVWYLVNGLEGVNLKTGKRTDAAELRQANPNLEKTWNVPRRTTLENFLSVGARPSPTRWLALLSTREAELLYKPKSWLQPVNRAENATPAPRERQRELLDHHRPEACSIRRGCQVIDLPRSTLYYRSAVTDKGLGDDRLAELIGTIQDELPRYGYRRVTHELRRRGHVVNHNRVVRVMNRLGVLLPGGNSGCLQPQGGGLRNLAQHRYDAGSGRTAIRRAKSTASARLHLPYRPRVAICK